MPRRRRDDGSRGGYDDMGRPAEPRGGDYYAQSDNGMPDTRPQRRREDGRGDRGGRDPRNDDRGGYDPYDNYPQPEEKKGGSIVKTILKVVLVILLTLIAFVLGGLVSLRLASDGSLPEPIANMFDVGGSVPEEDLLSTYGDEIADAVKDGTVQELLDEANQAEEEDELTADATTTTDPYGTTTQQQAVDPTQQQQQQVVDPTQQQQQVVDPAQQQVVNPAQQQIVDPTQQQVVDPNQQQQQVVDPNQQQVVAQTPQV